MADRHYDVIILGESLASRIAGVLLAKAGRRVLVAGGSQNNFQVPGPFPVSLHLERLLDNLGGRSCLAPPSPLQVFSEDVRLTIHGSFTLADELRREFGADGRGVENLLRDLEDIGERLEAALWDCGGLPIGGAASRWRFLCARLRRGLFLRVLNRPLSQKLSGVGAPKTSQTLAALFAGLSLTPIDRLTVAEGALLWQCFTCGRGISVDSLAELLLRRFEQFHGERAELAAQQPLDATGKGLAAVMLKDGRRCTADNYLVGSRQIEVLLPAKLRSEMGVAFVASRREVRIDKGRIPPLLAPVSILDGIPPLRVTPNQSSETDPCRILCESSSFPSLSAADLIRRLSPIFPFATLHVVPEAGFESSDPPPESVHRKRRFSGAPRTIAAGGNLLRCSGELVLPALGATGEILVGVSVANHLQRQKRQ